MITYEKATLDDAYGIEYVAAHSWKETYSYAVPQEYLDKRIANIEQGQEQIKEFMKEIEENYNGGYIIAKDDDKIIGFVSYHDDNRKDYGHIGALYLLQEYQGQGIGKELFKMAVQNLKDLGYSTIRLTCLMGNKTINFYRKYLGEGIGVILSSIDGKYYPTDVVEFKDADATLNLLKGKRK